MIDDGIPVGLKPHHTMSLTGVDISRMRQICSSKTYLHSLSRSAGINADQAPGIDITHSAHRHN